MVLAELGVTNQDLPQNLHITWPVNGNSARCGECMLKRQAKDGTIFCSASIYSKPISEISECESGPKTESPITHTIASFPVLDEEVTIWTQAFENSGLGPVNKRVRQLELKVMAQMKKEVAREMFPKQELGF